MNSPALHRLVLAAVVLSLGTPVLLAAARAGTAGAAGTSPSSVTASAANALPEVEIPRSVFTVPKDPGEGRDPFFPASTRPYAEFSTATRTNGAPGLMQVSLKGLAGPPDARFATISATPPSGKSRILNLTTGQADEVATSTGAVLIRCLEIKDESILLEVGGVRRELRLRGGF